MLAEQHSPLPDSATSNNGQPDKSSRDHKGRFAAGNRMGRGNPFARQVAALRTELLNRVTSTDIHAIADTLIGKAKEGDLVAVKLLFSYVLGKPGEQPDPDRLDLDEWQLLQEGMAKPEERERLAENVSLKLAIPVAKADLDQREAVHVAVAEGYTEDVARETARTRELFAEACRVSREEKARKTDQRPVQELFRKRAEASPRSEQGQQAPSVNGGDGAAEASSNGKQEKRSASAEKAAPSPHGHNGHAAALAQLTSFFGGLAGRGRNGSLPSPNGDCGDGELESPPPLQS